MSDLDKIKQELADKVIKSVKEMKGWQMRYPLTTTEGYSLKHEGSGIQIALPSFNHFEYSFWSAPLHERYKDKEYMDKCFKHPYTPYVIGHTHFHLDKQDVYNLFCHLMSKEQERMDNREMKAIQSVIDKFE